jgi:membrane-anchored mycosin MYCP
LEPSHDGTSAYLEGSMRSTRTAAGPVAAVLVGAGLAAAVPAYGQGQCLPEGETVTSVPWSQALLRPERAWPLATGAGQRVAVVSTGVAGTPYLTGAVAERVDLAPVDVGQPSGETDCLGVGTGVAGIIAAAPTDDVGFHGLAPDTRILDAKVVGDRLSTDPSGPVDAGALADGIDWAVEQGATVIVVPSPAFEESPALAEAVARAHAADIVVVAAVGEAGQNEPPDLVPYPAGSEDVLGVAALAPDGTAATSRTGEIDLVAPGVEVITTYPGGGLGPATGTAFAAGYVAGSVALLRAYRPDLSREEVVDRLLATAAPAPEGVGSTRYGYGIVDPYRSLVERITGGEPVTQPPYQPDEPTDQELARQAAQERGDALASRLAGISLLVAVAVVAAIGFGIRGRRRRWRPGIAQVPTERPEDDLPEPPLELLAERPLPQGGRD